MNWIVIGGSPLSPAALLVAAALAAAALLWWDGRRTTAPTAAAIRAVRHATLTHAMAFALVAVGFAAPVLWAVVLLPVQIPTRTVAVLPLLGLWGFLGVSAVGELTWPRPRGESRQARLVSRTASDVVATWARRRVWILVGALAVVSGTLGLAASGPRTISRLEAGRIVHTVGPYPGWLWTVPILVAVLVAAALTEAVLRLVALRAAVWDVDETWDMWLRRRMARRVTRVVQLVLGLALAGVLGLAGLALRHLGLGSPGVDGTSGTPAPGYVVIGDITFWIAVAVVLGTVLAAAWPARDPMPMATPHPSAEKVRP